MAPSLGSRVVAEGVENREQNDFLKDVDYDEIQGLYYSRPVSSDSIFKLLQSKKTFHAGE